MFQRLAGGIYNPTGHSLADINTSTWAMRAIGRMPRFGRTQSCSMRGPFPLFPDSSEQTLSFGMRSLGATACSYPISDCKSANLREGSASHMPLGATRKRKRAIRVCFTLPHTAIPGHPHPPPLEHARRILGMYIVYSR